jgi:hypothetical protein
LTAPEAYEEPLRQLQAKMQATSVGARHAAGSQTRNYAFGVPSPVRPIWFTEGAYYADDDKPSEPYHNWLKPLDSEVEAAGWQVKFNTLLLTYGVERIIYHSGTIGSLNNEDLAGVFFEWAGTPRKMLVAQSALASLLVPPVRPLGRLGSPQGTAAYGFESQGRTIIVAWAVEEAKPAIVSIAGKSWKAVDLQGNQLNAESVAVTERPVYFVTEKTKPEMLPWP